MTRENLEQSKLSFDNPLIKQITESNLNIQKDTKVLFSFAKKKKGQVIHVYEKGTTMSTAFKMTKKDRTYDVVDVMTSKGPYAIQLRNLIQLYL